MTMQVLAEHDISHLAGQFKNARPILFTGAGFSLGAKNITHQPCPSFADMKKKLWDVCFPGQPFDPESVVQDLYDLAQSQHKRSLIEYLKFSFAIDAPSLVLAQRELDF